MSELALRQNSNKLLDSFVLSYIYFFAPQFVQCAL